MPKDYSVDRVSGALIDNNTGLPIDEAQQHNKQIKALTALKKTGPNWKSNAAHYEKKKKPMNMVKYVSRINQLYSNQPNTDAWEAIKETSTDPEDIKQVRNAVNASYKKYGNKYLHGSDFKYLDKSEPKPAVELSSMIRPLEIDLVTPLKPSKTYEQFLEEIKSPYDDDLDGGLASIVGVSGKVNKNGS